MSERRKRNIESIANELARSDTDQESDDNKIESSSRSLSNLSSVTLPRRRKIRISDLRFDELDENSKDDPNYGSSEDDGISEHVQEEHSVSGHPKK